MALYAENINTVRKCQKAVVPWEEIVGIIESFNNTSRGGRPGIPLKIQPLKTNVG
jgi:hypothetical protein